MRASLLLPLIDFGEKNLSVRNNMLEVSASRGDRNVISGRERDKKF